MDQAWLLVGSWMAVVDIIAGGSLKLVIAIGNNHLVYLPRPIGVGKHLNSKSKARHLLLAPSGGESYGRYR